MPKLIVVNRAGEEQAVEGDNGLSVMEVIRDNGFWPCAAVAAPAPPAMSMSIPTSPMCCLR